MSVFVILRRDDEVLLLRRANTGWLDGSFSVPAGAIDGGETAASAAVREAREEICVRIRPGNLRLVHVLHSFTEGQEWTGCFFECLAWEGTPALGEPQKHSDLKWVRLSELPDGMVPYVRQVLLSLANSAPYSEYGWPDRAG